MRKIVWGIVALAMLAMLAIPAAAQEVYLVPQDSSASFCNTADVEVWVNATNFLTGQINLTYDSTCANVTNFARNTADFPMGGWTHSDGGEWITFVASSSLAGEYKIGTLTIHCVCENECSTTLDFVTTGENPCALFTPGGDEITGVTWIDGTFSTPAVPKEVYLVPQDSSASFCNTVDVEMWVNATNFLTGQIKLTYDSTCANVTNFARNTADFPMGGWTHSDGGEWITLVASSSLTGEYKIGTLTIHCVSEAECSTTLDFVTTGGNPCALFTPGGDEITGVNWIDGTFECTITPPLESITVSPPTKTLYVGDTQQFTATAKDENDNPMAGIIIAWTSSNTDVGTVSPATAKTGLDGTATTTFTASAVGTTTVKAENVSTDKSGTASVEVKRRYVGGAGRVLTPTPSPTPTPTPTAAPTAAPTAVPTAVPTAAPTAVPTAEPTATPKEPGFEAVFAIAGMLAIAYLVLRRKRK